MRSDRSNGEGLADRGPRKETTVDMSTGRLLHFDPGARVPRRQMSAAERSWLYGGPPQGDTQLTEGDK